MRSRYTAYVLGNRDYLLDTWHADYRPDLLSLDKNIKWLGLKIIDQQAESWRASVEFEAMMLVDQHVQVMHEKSRFVCQQGRWYYTDGEIKQTADRSFKPSRNAPCPCGSGIKFKRCCAR